MQEVHNVAVILGLNLHLGSATRCAILVKYGRANNRGSICFLDKIVQKMITHYNFFL